MDSSSEEIAANAAPDSPKTVGERVKQLRSFVPGLSQRGLDTLTGLHRGHVWQIERGAGENLERETSIALADFFGCSLDWLLKGEGKAPDPTTVAKHAEARRAAREDAA